MQRALTIMAFPTHPRPSAHGGRLLLVAVLMGLLAAAVLAAGDTAQAQTATTHQITRGGSDAALTTSLNTVFASGGGTLAAVSAGDTIKFGAGVYEDIGRSGVYLLLNKANLTVQGARDPRLREADGQCNPAKDTILTGSSGFSLRAANITLEHFCFQDIDDGSLAHANPHNLAAIRIEATGDNATIHLNRIDNTIGMGVDGRIGAGDLQNVTITENEFIDIGLIENNGAGEAIQPRGTGQEPSAIRLDTSRAKSNLTITDNLFDGSAWVALSLDNVDGDGGSISGNIFRDIAKSAVNLSGSSDVTLDNNTYEGNNHTAWRVVRRPNWLNDGTFGISGSASSKAGTMESAALQNLMRLNKAQAVAVGMDGDLYAAAPADKVYRDPRLHAAVRVVGSSGTIISNSAFSKNHNSIAICGHDVCRVDGLEAVGGSGDTGRAPAYISPATFPGGASRTASTVTLSGNRFNDSDTRSFEGPGSIGNHVVIGYWRANAANSNRGGAAGSITYGADGNSFKGSGVYGGAATSPPAPSTHQITRGGSDAALQSKLNTVFGSDGDTLAAVKVGDTIEFGPGVYDDIGRKNGFALWLDKAALTVRGASDPRLKKADGNCNSSTDTILTGSSGFELRASGITLEHFCFQNIDDGSLAHTGPHNLAAIRIRDTGSDATVRRNRINTTIGMGVDGRMNTSDLRNVTIAENEFIDIGLIENNGAGESIQPREGNAVPWAILFSSPWPGLPLSHFDTPVQARDLRIVDNLFERSARAAIRLHNVDGGTISGNTFRKMAKSAVDLYYSRDLTLDNNTYEGNNHAAWRVVSRTNWLDDLTVGLWGSTARSKTAALESSELQSFLRMARAEAVAAGMDGGLYDAAPANSVYRDPDLHAAVRLARLTNVVISNSTFTNNHNSISICGDVLCRVEGLNKVGDDDDTGRAPAYLTIEAAATSENTAVTLSGNQFNNSDTRSVDAPGSVGNHLVIGYRRVSDRNNQRASAVGSFIYKAGNIFTGDGVFGGAAASHRSRISMKKASAEVVEGASAVFNLTINPPARKDLTVKYSVSEVGGPWLGTLPDDDPATEGNQFTVAAGVTSAVLTIPTAPDRNDEEDGSITVRIDAGKRYIHGATARVNVRDGTGRVIPPTPPGGTPPVIVAPPPGGGGGAPPPIFVPPPPPFKKDEVAVVDGAARLEANKVTVDLGQGSLAENVETVEATVTKLTRSKTPDAPDGGRFSIPSSAAFEIELEATLADETTQTLTEFAIPVAVCLPIPSRVDNPVVLHYDAESEEWIKLPAVDSAEEDLVCAPTASFSDRFSVYAVADEAIHSEGLSATEINDFSVWEADYPLTATELLSAIEADLLWVRSDEEWIGYATFEGEPIPGAIDFPIANGDTLWLGSVGSGGDTDEEGEEGEG